jgi:ATP-dependent helicase/nuclease subunit A
LTKHGRADAGARDRSFDRPLDFNKLLELPKSVAQQDPTATERGSATHLALQHLSFVDGLDESKIASQLRSMVERKLMTEQQAKIVDTEAIAWFVTTPLGQLVTSHADRLRRELAVLVAEKTPADVDPLDRVMIRGRIDAMLALDDGLLLFDYKTDRVEGASLDERAEFYKPQLRAYRDALVGIVERPVKACHLVFLHARQVVDVD